MSRFLRENDRRLRLPYLLPLILLSVTLDSETHHCGQPAAELAVSWDNYAFPLCHTPLPSDAASNVEIKPRPGCVWPLDDFTTLTSCGEFVAGKRQRWRMVADMVGGEDILGISRHTLCTCAPRHHTTLFSPLWAVQARFAVARLAVCDTPAHCDLTVHSLPKSYRCIKDTRNTTQVVILWGHSCNEGSYTANTLVCASNMIRTELFCLLFSAVATLATDTRWHRTVLEPCTLHRPSPRLWRWFVSAFGYHRICFVHFCVNPILYLSSFLVCVHKKQQPPPPPPNKTTTNKNKKQKQKPKKIVSSCSVHLTLLGYVRRFPPWCLLWKRPGIRVASLQAKCSWYSQGNANYAEYFCARWNLHVILPFTW